MLVVSVYDKLKHIETCTWQALVRDLAAEVAPLIDPMGGALAPLVEGYPVRILDGNGIAASEHRIKELRATAAGALPGKSLVVLDPQRRLMLDVFPCEDGHAQERTLLEQVIPTVVGGELWIADRNFCTFVFLLAMDRRQGTEEAAAETDVRPGTSPRLDRQDTGATQPPEEEGDVTLKGLIPVRQEPCRHPARQLPRRHSAGGGDRAMIRRRWGVCRETGSDSCRL